MNKTAIAAYNCTNEEGSAMLVNHINSIFTAEAMAIILGVKRFASSGKNLIISDSKSVLSALNQVSQKSPTIIQHLYKVLTDHGEFNASFTLVWTPGHAGIKGNEMADCLAKNGPYDTRTFPGISPEDLKQKLKMEMQRKVNQWWEDSKYVNNYHHLGHMQSWTWGVPRFTETIISRLRTHTSLLNYRKYKFRISSSPLCQLCGNENETEDHILFDCPNGAVLRSRLFNALGRNFSSQDVSDFWEGVSVSPAGRLGCVNFLGCFRDLFV
jgi:ribonuclease HI